MPHILNRIVIRPRLESRLLSCDPDEGVPTLFWSPEYSLFFDAHGQHREVWGLTDRNDAAALCKMTNVVFVDKSDARRFNG